MKRTRWSVGLAAAFAFLTLAATAWAWSSASTAAARYSDALLSQDVAAASASGFYPGAKDFVGMREELLAGADVGSLTPHVSIRHPFLTWPLAVPATVTYERSGRSHPRELTLQLMLTPSGWQVYLIGVARSE